MPLLVAGSIAIDDVITPYDQREGVLGGSAIYFSYAASFFTSVRLVGVVGEDWPAEHTKLLQDRGIDTTGMDVVSGGKTFYWRGKYHENFKNRETLEVHLNVLEDFSPTLPEPFTRCPFLFLANGSPTTQMKVFEQVHGPRLAVADTMDLWLEIERDQLMALLKRLDGLVLNDEEARQLTDEDNLIKAGHKVRTMGPKFVVIKKGENGAMFFSENELYVLPAFPTETVIDPTGAGDCFAGGMMGYLAEQDNFEPTTLKTALAYGTLVASFTVEGFSLERLREIDREKIEDRMSDYRKMLSF